MAQVVCALNVESDRATFTWSEGPASFEPYQLDGQVFRDFQVLVRETRQHLGNLVKDYLHDPDNIATSSYELAEIGHELYLQIFDPGAGQARIASEARRWLEGLRNTRMVESLEIVVERPWSMPWNVVYDRKPKKEAFLSNDDSSARWRRFWGVRYNLTGGRKVNPLRRMPLLVDPDVLMVVDPHIRERLPIDQQQRLADLAAASKFTLVTSTDELSAAIKSNRPDLVYWMSHATPSALVLNDEEISPRQLRRLLRREDSDDPYELGGLGFLNACQTAEAAETGSFFEALHSVGFSGMIGTEHQTVDTFANPLGLDFLEAFLVARKPIGTVMRNLRARVPLGLLYGTYCPPQIRVKQRGDADDDLLDSSDESDSANVILIRPESGAALGATVTAARKAPPLPAQPYRSLAYYGYDDRALFAGRDVDVERFATSLDHDETRILILHGESGVGKSSFLRAGVIPYLEEECLGYRFLRARHEHDGRKADEESVLFIRATNDPFGQLAHALCSYCARPYTYQTPTGQDVEVDLPGVLTQLSGKSQDPGALREALQNDPALLGRLLGAIGDRLPHSAVLVIDQCEEIFTLAQTPADAETRQLALAMLRRAITAAGDFKMILSLRTEYYGRLIDRLRRGLQDSGAIREYLLTDFEEDALVQAIMRPTSDRKIRHSSEVPFDKYGFSYAEGVPEEIARRVVRYSTHRRDSVLPLVQVICTQLYECVREQSDRQITTADLEQLGGIEGGMRRHVERLLESILGENRRDEKAIKWLFTQLFLRQPDGSLTTALLPEDELARRWRGRMPFAQLLGSACQMRLLRVNSLRIGGQEERRYVSLGHDALAKLAAQWDEELSRGARMRKMAAVFGTVTAVAVLIAILSIGLFLEKRVALRTEQEKLDAVRGKLVAEQGKLVAEQGKLVAEQRASARQKKAIEAADGWLIDVSGDLQFYPGLKGTRERLLHKAEQTYRDLDEDTGEEPIEVTSEELESARARIRLGDVLRLQENRLKDAEDQYRAAVAICERLSNESSPAQRDAILMELANSHMGLGIVLTDHEKTEAENSFAKSLNLLDELLQQNPRDSDLRNGQARCRHGYAMLLMQDRADEAERQFQAATDEFRKLFSERNEPKYRSYLALTLFYHNELLSQTSRQQSPRQERLEAICQEFIDVCEDILKDDPGRLDYRQWKAEYRFKRARTLRGLGRLTDAIDAYQAAMIAFLHLQNEYARFTSTYLVDAQKELGPLLLDRGQSLLTQASYDEAARVFHDAVYVYEQLSAGDSDHPDYGQFWGYARNNRAVASTNQAQLLLKSGQAAEAKEKLEQSAGSLQELIDPNAPKEDLIRHLAATWLTLADAHRELGEDSRAEAQYGKAIGMYDHLVNQFGSQPQDRVDRAVGRSNLARLHHRMGRHADARLAFESAIGDFEAVIDQSPDDAFCSDSLAFSYTYLGDLLWAMREPEEASRSYRQALALREKLVARPAHRRNLARLLAECHDLELRHVDRGRELAQRLTEEEPEHADNWHLLGAIHDRAGEYDSSTRCLQTAMQLHPTADSADGFYLSMSLWQQGEHEPAKVHFDRADENMRKNRPGNIQRMALRTEAFRLLR